MARVSYGKRAFRRIDSPYESIKVELNRVLNTRYPIFNEQYAKLSYSDLELETNFFKVVGWNVLDEQNEMNVDRLRKIHQCAFVLTKSNELYGKLSRTFGGSEEEAKAYRVVAIVEMAITTGGPGVSINPVVKTGWSIVRSINSTGDLNKIFAIPQVSSSSPFEYVYGDDIKLMTKENELDMDFVLTGGNLPQEHRYFVILAKPYETTNNFVFVPVNFWRA